MTNFKLTWTNIIIAIVLFYVIGEILSSVKIYINKEIKQYEIKKRDEEFQKYREEENKRFKVTLDEIKKMEKLMEDSIDNEIKSRYKEFKTTK
jgi:uncharacterized membrane-anchored protein YhcB (DUF1043 family)